MLSRINTAALSGIEAYPVTVETDISRGLPAMNTVGLPSATIREARERIRAAVLNSGYGFPTGRITVNLSPASSRKEGSHFDLPMAIGILVSSGILPEACASEIGFLGELSLDGTLVPVTGALPLVIGMRDSGMKSVVLPRGNAEEAAMVSGIDIIAAASLSEAAAHASGECVISPYVSAAKRARGNAYEFDFADVAGQEYAKRAVTIAVAGGGHGIYMTGSPGAGKTMLARRIPTVMPKLEYEEMLELTKIYSVAGMLSEKEPFIGTRPFRMPYHASTVSALFGGGRIPRPGEISLAHHGVLFLDEFPEFDRKTIELLRQPLETGEVSIERVEGRTVFPADFMLVAAGNPCKCGYYGDRDRMCRCTGSEIRQYMSKLSGPIIDRIDIQIKVEKATADELGCGVSARKTSSFEMREQVLSAIERQEFRYKDEPRGNRRNSKLSGRGLAEYCGLSDPCRKLISDAYKAMGMSARGYERIIRISRTIADVDESSEIREEHIAEALQYRILDRMYIE